MARTQLHSGASGLTRTRFHANRGVRVEELRTELVQVTKKEDLTLLAAKADLDPLAAKADLAGLAEKEDLTLLAAKEDLTLLAAKADLTLLAAKADLPPLDTIDTIDRNVKILVQRPGGAIGRPFQMELPELTPEQGEKVGLCLRALNRVEDLVLDKDFNLERSNETLGGMSPEREMGMRTCLELLEAIGDTGQPSLADKFRDMLDYRFARGDFQERHELFRRIQDLRLTIIQQLAGATGNPPPAASL
jgi:hypothetical protein